MKKTLYANGKLFIMGEYTVLDGSDAFALPTRFGQSLEVETNDSDAIHWTSFDADGSVWLDVYIPLEDVYTGTTNSEHIETIMLTKVLHKAYKATTGVVTTGYNVVTKLTFPRLWGLGTSSTLISLVADWFGIDPYNLLAQTFGGSGYDIACAQQQEPLIFNMNNRNPTVHTVAFNPDFADKLYFVYLNQKQNSREAIAAYRKKQFDKPALVVQINKLIEEVSAATDLSSFSSALEKQEALLGGVLGIAPVQERLFPDFKGVVKSLGAWGGDFVLAASEENPIEYFTQKGFTTIVPYKEMVY